jgi:hypothetical protein
MDILVIFGATAASVGFGLLLMWLACTAFFAFLMRVERGDRILAKQTESCTAPLTHSNSGPR